MAANWTRPPLPKSIPPSEAFEVGTPEKVGVIDFAEGDVEINVDRRTIELVMINTGDRPIQIGAHYHIAECNRAMAFDREAAFGMRLDIASGTAVRFEPGQTRTVTLVPLKGARKVFGFRQDVMGGL